MMGYDRLGVKSSPEEMTTGATVWGSKAGRRVVFSPPDMTLFVKWTTTLLCAGFGTAMAAYWANIAYRNETDDVRSVLLPLILTIGAAFGARMGLYLGRSIVKDV